MICVLFLFVLLCSLDLSVIHVPMGIREALTAPLWSLLPAQKLLPGVQALEETREQDIDLSPVAKNSWVQVPHYKSVT